MEERKKAETSEENVSDNISYIFIPFRYLDSGDGSSLPAVLDQSGSWIQAADKMQYMLKYVADKIEGKESGKHRCVHYKLSEQAMKRFGISGNEFYTERHMWKGKETRFPFYILGVQLYCFTTSVNILAFQIHFVCGGSGNPDGEGDGQRLLTREQMLRISAAQYYLKKVSREKILSRDMSGVQETTLLGLAEKLMEQPDLTGKPDFFFYAGKDTERANLLTYIEAEYQEDYNYELYYLRRCYEESYLYFEDDKQREREIFSVVKNIIWGISPEAAVCIVCPEMDTGDFVRTKFSRNFNEQYLFMYVLLLHQKYVLYLFLTMIDTELYEDLEKLEEYRKKLYKFETDFVYSRVTEVPQYQNLYDRLADIFSLKDMFEDVREPLLTLAEVRRMELEKQQKSREDRMNKALFLLSLMGAFSALVDSHEIIEMYFGQLWSEKAVLGAQCGCAAVIILVLIYVFAVLFKSGKK